MVNYNNGKIYKIEDLAGEMCYIGSTTKEKLCQRMVNHRAKYTLWKSGKTNKVIVYDIFDKYGVENCRIILIENCPCESKDQLTSREAHYIRTIACVNKYIPGRTQKEYQTEYSELNKEAISRRKRQYYLHKKESNLLKTK